MYEHPGDDGENSSLDSNQWGNFETFSNTSLSIKIPTVTFKKILSRLMGEKNCIKKNKLHYKKNTLLLRNDEGT